MKFLQEIAIGYGDIDFEASSSYARARAVRRQSRIKKSFFLTINIVLKYISDHI